MSDEIMECPHCGQELSCTDWYGTNMGCTREAEKVGDIFECGNEKCEAHHFYTDENGNLQEGYPC